MGPQEFNINDIKMIKDCHGLQESKRLLLSEGSCSRLGHLDTLFSIVKVCPIFQDFATFCALNFVLFFVRWIPAFAGMTVKETGMIHPIKEESPVINCGGGFKKERCDNFGS
jgi:hypothetical protein